MFEKLAEAGHLGGNKINDVKGQSNLTHTFSGKQFLKPKHALGLYMLFPFCCIKRGKMGDVTGC